MPEHDAQSGTLRAGRPLTVGAVTVLPIERTASHADCLGTHAWISYFREPYAVVVSDAAGVRALGIRGEAIPLERLRASVPGLDELIEST